MRKAIFGILLALLLAPQTAIAASVSLPVEGYYQRQTLKGYGTVVDDAFHARHRALFPNNRFQNQFTGIHAAVDVEFTDRAATRRQISVRAVAAGRVIYAGDVAGYGGVIVIRHRQPEVVTTLYGHLRLRDLPVRVGQSVRQGQVIAYLGASFSAETSGARKHLHFGIHKGSALDLAGHEPSQSQLRAEWYNPNEWLTRHGAARQAPRLVAATPSPTSSPDASPTAKPQTEKPWFTRLIDWFKEIFR